MRSRRRAPLAAVVLAAALAACGSTQEPGITVDDTSGGPGSTSRPLAACPEGGPDESTPPAGCLGPDGEVLHPP